MKIAAAQIPSVDGDIDTNIRLHIETINQAAQHGVTMLIFPEMSLTGYLLKDANQHKFRLDDGRLDIFAELAIKFEMTLAVGAPLFNSESNDLYIGLATFTPNGTRDHYYKIYLHGEENDYFVAGSVPKVIPVLNQNVGLAICADTNNAAHPALLASHQSSVYAASVMFTANAYEVDAGAIKSYSQQHNMLTMMANYNVESGGWPGTGKSAVYWQGQELVCADEKQNQLVIAEYKNGHWHGELSSLELTL